MKLGQQVDDHLAVALRLYVGTAQLFIEIPPV
jgi:hypothetical protein